VGSRCYVLSRAGQASGSWLSYYPLGQENYMQYAIYTPNRFYNASEGQFGALDERRKAYEESLETNWYCVQTILYEQYLWDMRFWDKPKHLYSKEEIMKHIYIWIINHKAGNWRFNCGHCVYCMRKILAKGWATLEEVSTLVMRNNYIKYPDEIGTYDTDSEEEGEIEV